MPASEQPKYPSQSSVFREPTTAASKQHGPNKSHSADDAIWTHNLLRITSKDKALGEGQSSHPTPSSTTSSSAQHESDNGRPRKRVRFGDELLAHSLVPVMAGHTELSASTESSVCVDRSELQYLSPALSGLPQGTAPWINADCQAHMNLLGNLPVEDRYYLYRMKRIFSFPQKSVGRELLQAFLRFTYPLLPIMNRNTTVLSFENLYNREQSSPLLFHSIFFCVSRFVDQKVLQSAGFSDASEAQAYFFKRASIIYSFDCEPDQLIVLQSLMLLSYRWTDYSEEKDMRYWISSAVNVCIGMGMHKNIKTSVDMSSSDRCLWRRIFWILFSREKNIATGMGQPFLLTLNNCDVEPLTEVDFEEETFTFDEANFKLSRQNRTQVHVALRYVELQIRAEKFLLALQDTQNSQEILTTLEKLREIISPGIITSSVIAQEGFLVDDASTWTESNMFAVFLSLNHERLVMLYQRRHESAFIQAQKEAGSISVSGGLKSATEYLFESIEFAEIHEAIFTAAVRIVRMFEALLLKDYLRYTPSFVCTSSFHAMLTLTQELIRGTKNSPKYDVVLQYFNTGLKALKDLRNYWSVASWTYSLFSDLSVNDFQPLREMSSQNRENSRLPSQQPPLFSDIDNVGGPNDAEFYDHFKYLGDDISFSVDPFWELEGHGDQFNMPDLQ